MLVTTRDVSSDALVVHGYKIQATKFAIDAAHKLADLPFEFGRVGKGRGCDLNEDDPTLPFGVVAQQFGESVQLLHDTLDDVQLIASDNDLFPSIQLEEGLQLWLNVRPRAENEPQYMDAETSN